MAKRILISGEELDLYYDNEINFNMKVNTLGDISNRNSSNSNSIEIPRTANNEQILGYVGVMGNTSDTPYTSLRCDYIVGGTYIVTNGYLQILEANEDKYRIVIHDGIIDFTALLGNSVISDLDYSPENHILDFGTFENSFANTSGYIYALGDFGKDMSGVVSVETIAPSMYAHTIWDRIFASRGLNYTGSFFDTNTDWLSLLVPAGRGFSLSESAATEDNLGTAGTDTLTDNTNYGTYTSKTYTHNFNTETLAPAKGEIDGNGDLQINFTGTLRLVDTITYSQTNTRVRVYIKLNGVAKASLDLPYASTVSPQSLDITLQVTAGDVVSVDLTVDNPTPTGSAPAGYFTHIFSVDNAFDVYEISGGTLVTMNDYISTELTQKDFVKDILQRYGLIMLRNRIDFNQYDFIQMETLLDDRLNNIDWTSKLNTIVREKYQNNYAQSNISDYRYASGVVPYLTGYLNVVNSNAPFEKRIITAPYEIPEQSTKFVAGIRLFKFPVWEYNDDTLDYDNIETSPKLMRLTKDSTNVVFNIWGSGNTTITADIPYLTVDAMSYQNFLDTYYAHFKELLDSYKQVDVDLDLDIVDFKQIDFGKLIFLRQTGRYYYLDSVRVSETGAQAKLIEIRNFTY